MAWPSPAQKQLISLDFSLPREVLCTQWEWHEACSDPEYAPSVIFPKDKGPSKIRGTKIEDLNTT